MILLRIFKDSRTLGILGLLILSVAIFFNSFVHPGPLEGYVGMPFYTLIFGAIHTIPVIDRIVALLFVWIMGYLVVRLGITYVLLEQRSIMPALFLLLFSFSMPPSQQVSPALLGAIFYLLAFNIFFNVHDKPPDTILAFSGGLVLALGCMFYLKLIWFIPLIWISLGTLKNMTLRELLYPLVALALMILFLFTWYWGIMNNAGGFANLIKENLAFRNAFQQSHFSTYVYLVYMLMLVLLASIYMVNHFQVRKTASQLIFQVMFYMFVMGILFFFLIGLFEPTTLVYIGIPVAFILSNYFHRRKNILEHELALWLCLVLLVFAQVMAR